VVYYEVKRADPSKPLRKTRWSDGHSTLFRFDANGALISAKRMERAFVVPWIAVFDSGDFLLVDGEWGNGPTAWLYSSDGGPLKGVDLAKTALGGHDSDGGETHLFGAGDKAFIFIQWDKPEDNQGAAVATISSHGEVQGSAAVKLPKGSFLMNPRQKAGHLFGALHGVVLALAACCGPLCSCDNTQPPRVSTASLPLATRIERPDPSKYSTLEDIPWSVWKNPRLIVTPQGIVVLLCGATQGAAIPPQGIPDFLEHTSRSDWSLGLVVMAKKGYGSHGYFDEAELEALRRNTEKLSRVLGERGIALVWGPPPA
jgi:hypothetical protein